MTDSEYTVPELPSPGRMGARTILSMALALLFVAGCGETTTEPGPDPLTFQGSVQPTGEFAGFTGNVWVNTTSQQMAITVSFLNAPEADGFEWVIRYGDCNARGDIVGSVGDYPTINPDEGGIWDATVDVGFRDEPSVAMEIDVIPAVGGAVTPLGCATLLPVSED